MAKSVDEKTRAEVIRGETGEDRGVRGKEMVRNSQRDRPLEWRAKALYAETGRTSGRRSRTCMIQGNQRKITSYLRRNQKETYYYLARRAWMGKSGRREGEDTQGEGK